MACEILINLHVNVERILYNYLNSQLVPSSLAHPISSFVVFSLRSMHPERHHPTLLVLAHLHHSLHRLFDRRGHRLRSLGTWDNGRQQATHPAEGWRGKWKKRSVPSKFGVNLTTSAVSDSVKNQSLWFRKKHPIFIDLSPRKGKLIEWALTNLMLKIPMRQMFFHQTTLGQDVLLVSLLVKNLCFSCNFR